MDVQEIAWDGADRADLVQDWKPANFSRRTLLLCMHLAR